jgi:excisionase family DNA binding protein
VPETNAMKREIITVVQVADYVQISKKSVYNLVKEGKLSAFKVLNRLRFSKEIVDQFLANNQFEKN